MSLDKNYQGTDVNLETSLEEYGFVARPITVDYADEYFVIYKMDDNQYGSGHIRESELDAIVNGTEWASEDDVNSMLETVGASKQEWMDLPFTSKFSDLVSYWGTENIMGTDYYPNDKKWAFEEIGLEYDSNDDEFANGGGVESKYKVGQKFYDTRYDRTSQIVSTKRGLITWKRFNKTGTEFENNTEHSLFENQFDYLVQMGAYQLSKQFADGGGVKIKSAFRLYNSPLIKFANFKDGSHINLMRLIKPYKNGEKYGISKMSINKTDDEVRIFKTLQDAESYFDKMVNEKKRSIDLREEVHTTNNYAKGGMLGTDARLEYVTDAFASDSLQEELKEKLGIETDSLGDNYVISFAYTDYGGDFMDKVAIAYFKENYPDNTLVENAGYNGENAYVFGEPAKEWIETTQDYPLGFEDIEDFYYEKTSEQENEDFNYFLDEIKGDYSFDKDEALQWLNENRGGYYGMTTQGLDFSFEDLTNDLVSEGIIEPNEEDEDFADGGGVDDVSYEKIYEVLKENIDESIDDLGRTYENSSDFTGEEIEHKFRDGFIPYTNGGYELSWYEYVSTLNSTGYTLPTEKLQAEMQRHVDYSYELAKDTFKETYPEIVEELGEENIDYSSLNDAGYSDEAEELSEWEMENMSDEDTIRCSVIAYYYEPTNDRGQDGKHTISLQGDINLEAPYHRKGKNDDFTEVIFTFDSMEELKSKLEDGLKNVIDWFNGSKPTGSDDDTFAKGGKAKPKKPKMVRTQFEEEEFDYAKGGGISSKELDLNHQYTYVIDGDNNGSIYKEAGVYFVQGFENGKHFSETFKKLKEAKDFYISKAVKKHANGGGVDGDDRMYNFLKEDLEKLENAIKDGDNEEVDRFFSYWNYHLKSLKTKTNDRMYNFLKDDLEKLESAIKDGDNEEVDRFFSYWNYHLKSLKMAKGGGVDITSLKKGDVITILGDSYKFLRYETENDEERTVVRNLKDNSIVSMPKDMVEAYSKYKFANGGGVDDFKMSYDEMTTYEKSNHIHYNPMNSRWEVTKNGENKEFWNQEQAEKYAGFEFDNDKDSRYSRKKYEALFGYAKGGGVDDEVMEVSKAIFDSNNKRGKISTSFGSKSLDGLKSMIENTNYTSEEIANSIFYNNDKKGKISTSWGDKTYEGLLNMINNSRGNKYANGGGVDEIEKITDHNFNNIASFTKDPVYKKGNILVQRVGGSTMWSVAIDNEPKGRILNAFTQEQAFKKVEKEMFAKGGGVDDADWIEESLIDLQNETGFDDLVVENSDSNSYTASNGDAEFLVFETEDDARERAIELVKKDLEENLQYFSKDWLMDYVDGKDFFTGVYNEWNESYANDIESEDSDEYANRLIEEMVENGIVSSEEAKEDDFDAEDYKEDFVKLMTSNQIEEGNDGLDYYINNFGEEQAFKVVSDNNLINIDEASESAIDTDGIGHFLSRYDGEQIDLSNGHVAYRTN